MSVGCLRVLWSQYFDLVRLGYDRSVAARRVLLHHYANLDSKHALAQVHVSYGRVDVHFGGVTALNDVPILELHALGSLIAQFAGHDDFDTLCTGVHHKSYDTVARTTHGESTEKFVTQRLRLRNGGQTAVQYLLAEQLDSTFREFESLLDPRREFADTLSLLSKNFARARCFDLFLNRPNRRYTV